MSMTGNQTVKIQCMYVCMYVEDKSGGWMDLGKLSFNSSGRHVSGFTGKGDCGESSFSRSS